METVITVASPLLCVLAIRVCVASVGSGLMAASHIFEGGGDSSLGAMGSDALLFNSIRDTIFGGNQKLYSATEFILSTISAIGTAFLAPITTTVSGASATSEILSTEGRESESEIAATTQKVDNPYDLLNESGIPSTLDDIDRELLDSGNYRMQYEGVAEEETVNEGALHH